MGVRQLSEGDPINFVRKKEYQFVRNVGRGGCGETVLVCDPIIDECFVCKKHSPAYEEGKESLFPRFLSEIKILHKLSHRNIVRVFNYYLYPEEYTGYILMEYIEGTEFGIYLKKHPEHINSLFFQAVEAFAYLESNGVLHRDIRMANLLVDNEGVLKVIDFGFGKIICEGKKVSKSISLNWWCETPFDFTEEEYSHSTEVYFLGMLFKKVVDETQNSDFQYHLLLREMISLAPVSRISSFQLIKQKMLADDFEKFTFSNEQKRTYQNFADFISNCLVSLSDGVSYHEDVEIIAERLEGLCRNNSLEDSVQSSVSVLRCIIDGSYRYRTTKLLPVTDLVAFTDFFKSLPEGERRVVIANIHGRLDCVERKVEFSTMDDVPF